MHKTFILCLFITISYSLVIQDSHNYAIGLENINTGVIQGNYGFFGTDTSPGFVVKVDLSNNTRVGHITLNTGENYLVSSLFYNDCAYFAGSSGSISIVNVTSFSRKGSFNIPTSISASLLYGNYGYFSNSNTMAKVNLDTHSYEGSISIGSDNINGGISYSTFGYFVDNKGYIYKVDLVNMNVIGNMSVASNSWSSCAAKYGNIGYFCFSSYSSPIFVKINLDTFTIIANISVSDSQCSSITVVQNYAYIGGYYSTIVDLATFTVKQATQLSQLVSFATSYNNSVYYTIPHKAPGTIIVVNSSNVITSTISLDSPNSYLYSTISYNGYIYYLSQRNTLLLKIDQSNFSLVSTLSFQPNEIRISTWFVYGHLGYFTDQSTGYLIEIDLLYFNRTGTYYLGYSPQYSCVYGSTAYFTTSANTVIIYDLDSKYVVDTINVPQLPNYVTRDGDYLYVSLQSVVHRVNLNTLNTENITVWSLQGPINFYGSYGYLLDIIYLKQLDVANYSVVKSVNQGSYASYSVIYNNSIYLANSNTISEYPLSSLTLNKTLSISKTISSLTLGDDNFLYVGTLSGTGTIYKVNVNTFEVTSTTISSTTSSTLATSSSTTASSSTTSSTSSTSLSTSSTSDITTALSSGTTTSTLGSSLTLTSSTTSTASTSTSSTSDTSTSTSSSTTSSLSAVASSDSSTSSLLSSTSSTQSSSSSIASTTSSSETTSTFISTSSVSTSTSSTDSPVSNSASSSTLAATSSTSSTFTTSTSSSLSTSIPTTSTTSSSSISSVSSTSTSSTTSSAINSTLSSTLSSTITDGSTSSAQNVTIPTSDSVIAQITKSIKSNIFFSAVVLFSLCGILLIVVLLTLLLCKRRSRNPYPKSRRNTIEIDLIPMLTNITHLEEQARGNFGQIYKASWQGSPVALKALQENKDYKSFVKECNVLHQLSHPNIVQFMGIFKDKDQQLYLVTEFLSHGDLLTLVRNRSIDLVTMNDMVRQAASGMAYLHTMNIIHRDLALRNLLVTMNENKYIIKVADFGMSSVLGDKPVYYQGKIGPVPIKWTAPEVLRFGKVTMASDIWSFGICLWELFSKGEIPYAALSPLEILDHLNVGYRLPQPRNCPKEIYKIMQSCWNENYEDRPSFEDILDMLPMEIKKEERRRDLVSILNVNKDYNFIR